MKGFLIVIMLFFFSCNDNASNQSDMLAETNKDTVLLTKKEVESIDYIEYSLSNPSKRVLKNWDSYTELQEFLTSVKNADLSYLTGDEEVIKTFIKDLKTTVPERINSEAILARITALETKFFKLKSAVLISNTPKEDLLSTIKEFFEACSDLNLQINKKFEKEAQSVSKSNL